MNERDKGRRERKERERERDPKYGARGVSIAEFRGQGAASGARDRVARACTCGRVGGWAVVGVGGWVGGRLCVGGVGGWVCGRV